jgi:hypothetical protein
LNEPAFDELLRRLAEAEMKRAAGRTRDLADIEDLDAATD